MIQTDEPRLSVVGVFAVCLFAGGVVFRILKYKHDLEDKPHVFIRKSQ